MGISVRYRLSRRSRGSVDGRLVERLMSKPKPKPDADDPATPGWPDMTKPDSRGGGKE